MIRRVCAAIALAALPCAALEAADTLDVPGDEPYVHEATGMTFPPSFLSFANRRVMRFGSKDDVAGDYSDGGGSYVTVYLTRVGTPDPSLWFHRAAMAMRGNDRIPVEVGDVLQPVIFTAPGFARDSGLTAAFRVKAGGLRSTGLTVIAYGDYIVKLRVSSARLDSEGLVLLMQGVLSGLAFPKPTGIEPEPYALEACEKTLTPDAEAVQQEGGNMAGMAAAFAPMAGGVGKAVNEKGKPLGLAATRYCSDVELGGSRWVYRPNGSEHGYLIAYNDTGRAVIVGGGGMTFVDGKENKFGIALIHQLPEGNFVYRPFTTMPAVDAALEAVNTQQAIAFTNRDDKVNVFTGKDGAN